MANTGNTQQIINYGATANDGTGDPLRTAFIKTDDNFDNVWLAGPVGSNITISNNTIQSNNTNGNIILKPNGVGIVQANASIIPNADNTRDLGSSALGWRRAYINELLPENLTVSGDATIGGNLTVEGDTIQIGNITTDTLTVQLANTAANRTAANGAGVTVGANDAIATFLFNSTSNVWVTNIGANISGNITAGYFIGNGSLLTGVTGSYGNANVAAYLPTYTGNITAGNISVSDRVNVALNLNAKTGTFTGDATGTNSIYAGFPTFTVLGSDVIAQFSGNVGAYTQFNLQNYSTGNQASGDYVITADNGNDTTHFLNIGLTGGNWDGSQPNSLNSRLGPNDGYMYVQDGNLAIGVKDGNVTDWIWRFDITGSVTADGNLIPSANGVYSLGNSTNYWANLWVANNTIYIGGVPLGMTAGNVLTVNGNAVLSNGSNTTVSTTGNITAGNVLTGGTVSATGNISANYFVGNGSLLTGLAATYGNANVVANLAALASNPISTTGNVTGGNILTGGLISATGNITAGNISTGKITLTNGAVIKDTAGDAVAFGQQAGETSQGSSAVAIGQYAGNTSQGQYSVAIGQYAGYDGQERHNVAIGTEAGMNNQGEDSVAIGWLAGRDDQTRFSIAIGWNAGSNTQGQLAQAYGRNAGAYYQQSGAVAMGYDAGRYLQKQQAIAIGSNAGYGSPQSGTVASMPSPDVVRIFGSTSTLYNGMTVVGGSIDPTTGITIVGLSGEDITLSSVPATPLTNGTNLNFYSAQSSGAIAIGSSAAQALQGQNAVAVGYRAGQTRQGNASVSIGEDAGQTTQGANAVAIGISAGETSQGINAVAIGTYAGQTSQGNNSIILNATGLTLDQTTANTLTVAPVRNDVANIGNVMFYNATSKEITYGNVISVTGNITAGNILTGGLVSATGNLSGGNLNVTGNIIDTGALSVITGSNGNIALVPNGTGIVTVSSALSVTGNITGNTAGFAIGYRDIPQVSFTDNTTLAATDAGKHYYSTLATANTLTIANNTSVSWAVGTAITVVNRGSGNITVAQGTGVSLYLAGNSSAGNRTIATYGMATLLNVAANVWMINGSQVT